MGPPPGLAASPLTLALACPYRLQAVLAINCLPLRARACTHLRLSRHAAHHYDHGRTYIVMGRQPHAVPHGQPTALAHAERAADAEHKKSRSSRVEKVPGKPPGPGGPGPTSPALSGRLSIMQRGRLGQLDDNCRRRQGLGQPGRVAVPGRAGRPPAAQGRPRARPGRLDLELGEGLPRERAAAAKESFGRVG